MLYYYKKTGEIEISKTYNRLTEKVVEELLQAGSWQEDNLCFGWIDGQMEKIDDETYKKYFFGAEKMANGQRKIRHW